MILNPMVTQYGFGIRSDEDIRNTVWQHPSRRLALSYIRPLLAGPGEYWECGVYKGYTAALFHSVIGDNHTLRLFDMFSECPESTVEDEGPGSRVRWDWKTTLQEAASRVSGPNVHFHVGRVPDTFKGLEDSKIAFVYLDLTLYEGTKGTLEFTFPRLVPGGVILVRDYCGSHTWPGLERAVDESGLKVERHGWDGIIHGNY